MIWVLWLLSPTIGGAWLTWNAEYFERNPYVKPENAFWFAFNITLCFLAFYLPLLAQAYVILDNGVFTCYAMDLNYVVYMRVSIFSSECSRDLETPVRDKQSDIFLKQITRASAFIVANVFLMTYCNAWIPFQDRLTANLIYGVVTAVFTIFAFVLGTPDEFEYSARRRAAEYAALQSKLTYLRQKLAERQKEVADVERQLSETFGDLKV